MYIHRASGNEFFVDEYPGPLSDVYRGIWRSGPLKGEPGKYTRTHFERCFRLAEDASETPLAIEHWGRRE